MAHAVSRYASTLSAGLMGLLVVQTIKVYNYSHNLSSPLYTYKVIIS
jgi:hypothetical protein